MIYRPRAGTLPTGLIARISLSIDRLPTHAGGDRSFPGRLPRAPDGRGGRGPERGSQGENGGRPPPFPGAAPSPDLDLPRDGAERIVAVRQGVSAIGKPPHPGRARSGGTKARVPAGILPTDPLVASRRPGAGEPLGGPAIARSGRVVRPVRRPSDRQSPRRNASGDPREICNHSDPSHEARVELIPGARR